MAKKDKVRTAVMAGIGDVTREFTTKVFPQAAADWTPEQLAIYNFLNGESGGITRLHESDRPEITKQLAKIAGIEDMKSRFSLNEYVEIPPYVVVVLRDSIDSYPEGFPLIHGRIQGYWTEQGRGSSKEFMVRPKNLRPVTDDDLTTIAERFPDEKLSNLFGAIKFPDKAKYLSEVAQAIQLRTHTFAGKLVETFPEGISEKGKAIMKLTISTDMLKALSIILDDPKMNEPYRPAPSAVEFEPFVAVVHNTNENGQTYERGRVHIQAGISPTDVFLHWHDVLQESGPLYGNHADSRVATFRVATDDEIVDYLTHVPDDRLHLYASALSREQVASLL